MSRDKTPRPVSRQKLQKLMVSQADAFTALRYLRHRENTPQLPKLEEDGQKTLPGTEGVLADLYYSLWEPEPQVKEEDQTPQDRRYWRTMLESTQSSAAFSELQAQTQLSDLKSILGTISMGETILVNVPNEDKEKLQQLNQAQAEADQAQQMADQAQAQVMAAQMIADAAADQQNANSNQAGGSASADSSQSANGQNQSSGAPAPSQPSSSSSQSSANGSPSSGQAQMTPQQAKALANQLAQQAASAQADAKAAQELADEAKAAAQSAANDLLGKPGSQQAVDKLRELTRIGLSAVQQAKDQVKEVSETLDAWGLEEAELTNRPFPEALRLLQKLKSNKNLKQFAALLGRIRQIAARKARSKIKGEGVRRSVIETGRDIKRAHRRELTALVHPATRAKALCRWARSELQLHGEKASKKLGHGPVIVCEDSSGSMDGSKQRWAKAVVLAMANYAKIQKRSFGWIMFDSRVKRAATFEKGRISPEQMLSIAEARSGGGTKFEKPLTRAIQMIKNDGLKKADIVMITDGECAVSDEFLQQLRADKKALEFNIFTVLCDVDSTSDSSVKEFSDKVELASHFTAEEAEAKLFRNL